MYYSPTITEVIFANILIERGIKCVWNLNIYDLSRAFELEIIYKPISTTMVGKREIIIDSRIPPRQQYEDFLHELCHYILEHKNFLQLDEDEWLQTELIADNVMQYIAMPHFLVNTIIILENVENIANYFFVSTELAKMRLNNILKRLYNI